MQCIRRLNTEVDHSITKLKIKNLDKLLAYNVNLFSGDSVIESYSNAHEAVDRWSMVFERVTRVSDQFKSSLTTEFGPLYNTETCCLTFNSRLKQSNY